MPGDEAGFRSHLTLVLCMLMHGLTHAFATLLVPLYLPIRDDLKLRGVGAASLIVTVYGMVYCLASYPAGVLADRLNRKALLGGGLIVNGIAILLMGLTRRYEWIVALGVTGGLAGTLFHPSANALCTAHYPRSPGMAIGILSIGAALGFFAGPRYAGWRAESAGWQAPLVEAGLFGIAFGIFFLIVAKEARRPASPKTIDGAADGDISPLRLTDERSLPVPARKRQNSHVPIPSVLRWRMIAVSTVLAGRDFTGLATLSLASIYLQKARGMSVSQAGLVIGSMMLIAVVANPCAVYFSQRDRRLPVLCGMLVVGGLIVACVPLAGVRYVLPVLCVFQAFHLGSYAVSEAAILERVPAAVRGRIIGIFLTIAGTIASASPWLMGAWTDSMKAAASEPRSYALPFGTLGLLHISASLSVLLISKLGAAPRERTTEPMSGPQLATLEVTG